jgi:hypothetical protein
MRSFEVGEEVLSRITNNFRSLFSVLVRLLADDLAIVLAIQEKRGELNFPNDLSFTEDRHFGLLSYLYLRADLVGIAVEVFVLGLD